MSDAADLIRHMATVRPITRKPDVAAAYRTTAASLRHSADYTFEQYRCLDRRCGHIGPSPIKLVEESHGEMTFEPRCEKCWSTDVIECDDERE